MKRLWKSLALSLSVMATGARGQEVPAPTQPAAMIGRPVALIGRPVPMTQPAAPPVYDPRLQPASYNNGDGTQIIVRGSAPDAVPGTPTSNWRPLDPVNQAMFGWRSPGDELAPQPLPTGAPSVVVVPSAPGPVTSDHIIAPPVTSGPVLSSGDCGCGANAGGSGHCGLLGCGGGLFGFGHFDGGQTSSCFESCAGDCDGCYRNDRFYAKGEFLLWSIKGSPTPPLVTMSNVGVGNMLTQGSLTNSTVLFGGSNESGGGVPGGRFTAGYWFTDDHLLGVEGSFFILGQKNGGATTSSNGGPDDPQIGRPATFVAQPAGFPASTFGNLTGPGRELVAGVQLFPDGTTGTLAGRVIVGTSSSLWARMRTFAPTWRVDRPSTSMRSPASAP